MGNIHRAFQIVSLPIQGALYSHLRIETSNIYWKYHWRRSISIPLFFGGGGGRGVSKFIPAKKGNFYLYFYKLTFFIDYYLGYAELFNLGRKNNEQCYKLLYQQLSVL